MALIHLDNLDDPRLEVYRDLKATNLTRWADRFIAEGKLVVERLLESDYRVESLLVSERRAVEFENKLPAGVPMFVVPQAAATQFLGYNFHAGVLACGYRRPAASLEDVATPNSQALLVVCDRVNNPENVGSIIRLCAGFGASGMIFGPGCCDPFSRRVLRVSMGTALSMPIAESNDPSATLQRLKRELRVDLAATVLDPRAEPLHSVRRSDRLALVFGNEKHGLDEHVLRECDRRITIPMQPNADSLNVALAAGICLYHFTREGNPGDAARLTSARSVESSSPKSTPGL